MVKSMKGIFLYISVFQRANDTPLIYIINLTHNIPSESDLINAIGMDAITKLFHDIKPRLHEIIHGGFLITLKDMVQLLQRMLVTL